MGGAGVARGDVLRFALVQENAALRHRNTQLLRQLDDNALVLENKRLRVRVLLSGSDYCVRWSDAGLAVTLSWRASAVAE